MIHELKTAAVRARQTFSLDSRRGRLACSSSALILASCAALTAGVSTASAQTTPSAAPGPVLAAATTDAAAAAATTSSGATASSSSSSSSASSPTLVGELIVTARLRSESLQKVPENVVAISPEVLKNNEITNFFELQGFAPSVDVSTNYIKDYSSVLIRGFSASAYFNEVNTQPYSIYDISGVQILYGPQGTLFGFTALGGAVLYTPYHPQMNTYGAGVDVMLGNLNMTNVQGYVNIPLVPDQLAMRIAFERDHTNGYTNLQGSSGPPLDSNDNEGLRIGLEWHPGDGRFTNYFLAQWDHQYDTPTSRVVTAYNPFYVPATYPGTEFAAECTPTIVANTTLWLAGTTQAQCEAQHAAVYDNFATSVTSALALTRSSHDRTIPGPIENAPLVQLADNVGVEDIANYDVVHWSGFLGGGDISFHNIATDIWYRNYVNNFTVGAFDYYAASGQQDIIPTQTSQLQPGSTTNPNSVFGNGAELGNMNDYWQDEFQIHGTLDTALGDTPGVSWVVGFFNYWAQAEHNPTIQTSQNLPISYDGAFTANEGPVPAAAFPDGYWTADYDQYINVTIDSGMFWKPLKGLEFTGGFRFNHNLTTSQTLNVVTNYNNPNPFTPGTTVSHVRTETNPDNWNWSVNYVTPHNNLYVSSAYIVVAGFANAVPSVPIADVPGYVPFAANETLQDYEAGDKWSFNFGGVRGYADLDGYYEKLGNVQIAQTVYVPPLGTYFTYTSNLADLTKEGVEFQGEIFPWRNLDIYANFSYSHDFYSNYYESDPTGFAKAYYVGDMCVAGVSPAACGAPGASANNSQYCVASKSLATVPAANRNVIGAPGTCIMNFSATPVPYVPTWQASIRARYTFELGDQIGNVVPSLSASFQSREYFSAQFNTLREAQILGQQVYAATSSPSWVNLNLRLEWDKPLGHENLTAAAFATNVTNATYAIGDIDTLFAIGVATETFNAPREFGVEVNAKF